ncbi:MAG: PfkB family carbohydrate kinase [Clostridia bacterium]|nr:PfkB family carbohydrate kinase [Clostridia bacterium]
MVHWNNRESARKILLIGDIMLDQYNIGMPRPLYQETEISCFLGGAAGIAANIKNMGGQVTLAGVVGKDENGDILRRLLNQKDIPAVIGVDSTRPTTVKKQISIRGQLMVRLDREQLGDIPMGIFHDILKVMAVLLEDVKLVSILDYGKGVVTRELVMAVIEICQSKNIPVIVDSNGLDFSKYKGADVLKLSFQAMETLYGKEILGIDDLETAMKLLYTVTECRACIVSWLIPIPANGVIFFRSPSDWIHFPWALNRKEIHFPCADDLFMAALAIAAAQGCSMESSCRMAGETAAACL